MAAGSGWGVRNVPGLLFGESHNLRLVHHLIHVAIFGSVLIIDVLQSFHGQKQLILRVHQCRLFECHCCRCSVLWSFDGRK